MNPVIIFSIFIGYTILLLIVSSITSRNSSNLTFFRANKSSPWYVVAYGMIGASLSGVTFISVPGWVIDSGFSYLMIVLGYIVGYLIIATLLLPMYYRLNLVSIYGFLGQRFGFWAHKSGAFYFLLSRIVGAAFRMFLIVNVLQIFIFDQWGIPFWATVLFFIFLIWLYTFRSGIKTIVWTDTLQTTFMIAALALSLYLIGKPLDVDVFDLWGMIRKSGLSKAVITEVNHPHFYLKQLLSGAFIAIVMTGLDQDMMQKNLTCRNLKDAQKNIVSLSIALVPVNLLFLFLGASLYLYAQNNFIPLPEMTDDLFPSIAINHLGLFSGVIFIIGLIAAAYSSADSALTSLTTSFSFDFLNINSNKRWNEKEKIRVRKVVHLFISVILALVIIGFKLINNEAVISQLFKIAGYTYGPLLGLFAFGLFIKRSVRDHWIPLIVVLSPFISILINTYSKKLFSGYEFGFEILLVNGLLTFIGLLFISRKKSG